MTAECRNGHREFIEEFIEIYKKERCLWHIKSKVYHDRSKKDAAYVKLVEKLKEIDPAANRESAVKKINNIRSNYRKELKKIKSSSSSKNGDIYVPKLWYFKLLSFLNDLEKPKSSCTNADNNENESEDDTYKMEGDLYRAPQFISLPNELDSDASGNDFSLEIIPDKVPKKECSSSSSSTLNLFEVIKRPVHDVFEEPEVLPRTHLKTTEEHHIYSDKINQLKLQCAELDVRIRRYELKTKKKKTEVEESESNIRRDILKIELEHAKIKLEIDKRKLKSMD